MKKLLMRTLAIMSLSSLLFVQMASAVVSETEDPYTDDPAIEVTVEGSLNAEGKADLSWSEYQGDDLKWYKVVHSVDNPDAYYPVDGYIGVYTDPTVTTHTHTEVSSGTNYYRVCVITDDNRRGCSNTVTIEKEGATDTTDTADTTQDPYTDDASIEISLSGNLNENGKAELSWSEYTDEDLKWYKVVHSQDNPEPKYPQDGYVAVISDATKTTHTHPDVKAGTNYYSVCVITTDDRRGCSNTVTIEKEAATTVFEDTEQHWAKEYISDLAEKEVVEGYEDGTFQPDKEVSRSEAFKMIMQGIGFTPVSCNSDLFPDLNNEDWFCGIVTLAVKKGFVEGDEGMLYPARNISRAEAVKVLLEAKGVEPPQVDENPFPDVDTSAWYAGYAYKAELLGYIEGINGKFEPDKDITRAELAKIVSLAAK